MIPSIIIIRAITTVGEFTIRLRMEAKMLLKSFQKNWPHKTTGICEVARLTAITSGAPTAGLISSSIEEQRDREQAELVEFRHCTIRPMAQSVAEISHGWEVTA